MKGLLLVLVLSPVILFGQVRQKALIDSIKAVSPNLQKVSAVVNKYPGARVEDIAVSDSDEYITVVVRVHVKEAPVIPMLPSRPPMPIKIEGIAANSMTTVTIPSIPIHILVADSIKPLSRQAVFKINAEANPFVKMDPVAVPPLPDVKAQIQALPHHAISLFKPEDILIVKGKIITVPALPEIISDITLPLVAAVTFIVEDIHVTKIDTVAVPSFEEKRMSVPEMHLSDEGYALLEKMEGFSPELYTLKDGGFTIGFGFFVPYNEVSKWRKGVTMEEAERIIRQKVPAYEDQVKKYINVPLTQEEFDALTMLAYNLGSFSRATSIVNDVNSNADFEKLQRDWMRFVHSKAPGVMKGLMNRRKDEMLVRSESNYQPERKLLIFKNRK
jgi:GH24 family phage-related lysozyme (muramidase)